MAGPAQRPPYAPRPFEAVARADGLGVRISLRGELDSAGTAKLARVVRGVESFVGMRVVLDLSELVLVDAGGIGAIGRTRDRLTRHGLHVTVLAPAGRPASARGPRADDRFEAPTAPSRTWAAS